MHIFTAGQKVKLNPDRGEPYPGFKAGLGKEPFTLLRTEEIPEPQCNCGLTEEAIEDGWPHMPDCPVNAPNEVGHPQWVVIKNASGKERHLSGYWLIPA